ncbi:hypothetical protein SLEP1_g34193 [Rubroshorea leprosula]|uniref:Uncharacterized protein n=1 Tax=Rubroshorea leprosula TaxID=152421 RepID=A0AAV5KJ94_9ROSI|nr:hypothetical protein SLEP1_g34193 [Rubroshorea leprosula]
MLRLQRFIELSMRNTTLAIANRRSWSWRKSFHRRTMRGMKKAIITRGQSSHGAGRRGEKPAVDLASPQPPLIVSQSSPASTENSNPRCPSNVISHGAEQRGGSVLTEAKGSSSKVGKKCKISRIQKVKENLKRMKAEVVKQRAETSHIRQLLMEETAIFQAAAEGIESVLVQAWAENELMLEQNQEDQYLLMLGAGDIAGSFNPASGGYTPANRGPASGDYTLAVTYRGDVYFVPVLYSFFVITLVGML